MDQAQSLKTGDVLIVSPSADQLPDPDARKWEGLKVEFVGVNHAGHVIVQAGMKRLLFRRCDLLRLNP